MYLPIQDKEKRPMKRGVGSTENKGDRRITTGSQVKTSSSSSSSSSATSKTSASNSSDIIELMDSDDEEEDEDEDGDYDVVKDEIDDRKSRVTIKNDSRGNSSSSSRSVRRSNDGLKSKSSHAVSPLSRSGYGSTPTPLPMFNICFVGRLTPNSTCEKLAFFPVFAESKLECENLQIGWNWKSRIKGFLFFDAEFKHISNNKLRINMPGYQDLNAYLNDAQNNRTFLYSPKNASPEFKNWLQSCHKDFDREHR